VPPVRLILTRHGETVANESRRFSGHSDVALTRRGRAQARALARRLRREPITAAYSSDLSRARETAEITLQGRGIAVEINAGLRELSFGDWEGLTFDEVRAGWPDQFARLLAIEKDFCAPGGEPITVARGRVVSAAMGIAARHAGETVLIAAHGGTLQLLLSHLLGMPPNCMFRIATGNCGVSIVEFHGERPFVTLVNDCAHTQPRRARTVGRL
jgi:broad specificity phosphatase PhoE